MPFIVSPPGRAIAGKPLRLAALLIGLFGGSTPAQQADFLYHNANIYTADREHPRAKSLAVTGDTILAVGDDLSSHAGPNTRKIDLAGATVTPGFIDAHGHMAGLGQSMETLDLRRTRSAADAARIVAEAALRRPAGEWIVGRGWDQTLWPGGEFPGTTLLDRAAPNHPVYLTRVDGHAAWVNLRALAIADVNAGSPEPAGGRILGGVLIDRAMALVSRKIPKPDATVIRSRIERAAKECARLGLTTVHDAGIGEEEIAAYRDLVAHGRVPIRIYGMIGGEGKLWRHYLENGPEVGDRFTIRSIKLMADGALGSRGAALNAPYSDDASQSGLLLLRKEDVERVARDAAKAGFQVNTHAIGDRANRMVLEAYAAALGGNNSARFRVEHAQIVSPADFDLFARHSIVASMQATHATSDMRWAEQRIGGERIGGAYAWKTMLDRGVVVANGSDFPVESPDPMLGFYASVTRQDENGNPSGGWLPGETLSREEALRSWTWAGAYAAFEESRKGTLAAGKLADFIVLSNDIMTAPARRILSTRVTRTVVGGRSVREEKFHALVPIPPGRPKYIDLGRIDRPATAVCRFSVHGRNAEVRAMVISKEDLAYYQQQGWEKFSGGGRFVPSGELRVPLKREGEYVLVFDNHSKGTTPIRALVDAAFEYDVPVEPRSLPTSRRLLVVGTSLGLLAMASGFGGWRVMRAFRNRDETD